MKGYQNQHHIDKILNKDYNGNFEQQNVIPLSISTITNEYLHQTMEKCSTNTQISKHQRPIGYKSNSESDPTGSLEAKENNSTRFHKLRKGFSKSNIEFLHTLKVSSTEGKERENWENTKSKIELLQTLKVSSNETREPDKLENNICLETTNSQHKLFTGEKPKMLTQVLCAIVVALTQLGNGIMMSFSGITLPQMTQPQSQDIYLPPSYASLFGSIITIGAAIGGLMCGYLAGKLGHLKTIILIQPIILSLWFLLAFSSNPMVVVATRAFMGIFTGIVAPCATAYILEIAHKDHRGILFAAIPTAKQLGYLCTSMLGITSLSWRYMALICGVPTTVLPFIGLFFFPRSPRWLVTHGMNEEAKKSLIFFRGNNYDSQPELIDINEQVEKDKDISDISTQLKGLVRKPVANIYLLLIFLSAFGNLHGSMAVTSFTVIIFENSSVIDSYTCAMLIAMMRMVGNVFYVLLIDRIGRRPLHIYSYAAIGLSHGFIGASFYIKELEWLGNKIDWLQLVSVLIYTYFVALGLSALTIMQGELIPTSVRPTGISILSSMVYLGSFIVAEAYFPMAEALGQYGTFWTFGVGSLIVAIVSYFFLPETKGRSLEEISDGRKTKKNKEKSTW